MRIDSATYTCLDKILKSWMKRNELLAHSCQLILTCKSIHVQYDSDRLRSVDSNA